MIVTEYLNDGKLVKHYSDKGVLLLQVETGIKYSEPVDIVPCGYTYEESDELIESDEDEIEESDELIESDKDEIEETDEIDELFIL